MGHPKKQKQIPHTVRQVQGERVRDDSVDRRIGPRPRYKVRSWPEERKTRSGLMYSRASNG